MSVTLATIMKYIKPSSNYTDNFQAYSTGNLNNQGNWKQCQNNILVSDTAGDKRIDGADAVESCSYIDGTYPNDQFAQVTIDAIGASNQSFTGPAVRCNAGGNRYQVYLSTGSIYVDKVVSSIQTTLDSVTTGFSPSAGDVLRIEVVSNVLRILLNGSPITNLGDGSGYITDGASSIASGKPGVCAYGHSTIHTYADDFSCTSPS
jgi:hypothetical protein